MTQLKASTPTANSPSSDGARHAALVTGGSSGIGLATAGVLLADGYEVTICGRNEDRLGAAATALATHGSPHVVRADVTDPAGVEGLMAQHEERFGRLDVLVHCAGAVDLGGVVGAGPDPLDAMLTSNVRSAWLVSSAAAPLLRTAGQEHGRGVAVVVGSILGRHGQGVTAAYSTAKAALFGMVQALHDELSANGVRATTLAPALVDTPMTEPLAHLDRDSLLRPSDVAEAVRFLTRLSGSCAVPEILLLRSEDRLLGL